MFKTRMLHFLNDLMDGLDWLVYPPRCHLCHQTIEQSRDLFCRSCWQDLNRWLGSDYCRRCGRTASRYAIVNNRCAGCQEDLPIYDGLLRVGEYDGALRQMLLAFKFQEQTEYAAWFGGWLRDALAASGWQERIELFVPVPLHWRRWLERGYNQAALLAKQVCRKPAGMSCDLARIRYTRRQWQLTESQRRRNVKGAFAARKGHPFLGKTICLVDDIATTGATLNECAQVLKEVGASAVFALVVATGHADTM